MTEVARLVIVYCLCLGLGGGTRLRRNGVTLCFSLSLQASNQSRGYGVRQSLTVIDRRLDE